MPPGGSPPNVPLVPPPALFLRAYEPLFFPKFSALFLRGPPFFWGWVGGCGEILFKSSSGLGWDLLFVLKRMPSWM